jgi:integrase
MFRWAVGEELLPAAVYQALQAVTGLRKGRSAAKEADPIEPVPEEAVRATLPHLPLQVAAMVRIQLLTGARPGEVAAIRPGDLSPSPDGLLIYRPGSHKTEHLDRRRVIVLGPQAQEVISPWLNRPPDAYCFSPVEASAWGVRGRGERPDPPVTTPRLARTGGSGARRRPGPRYTKDAYRWAIARACRRAGVPQWCPLQLRHSAATKIRSRFGLEAAQTVLGHAEADTTPIYAERDLDRARTIMAEIG